MLKKIRTKSLILFLAVLSLSLILSINNNAEANMFNKFKKGFYFEKYKTAEEAQKVLLELHPIGSDVGELVRTLDIAMNRKQVFDKSVDNLQDRMSKKGSYFYFDYKQFTVPFLGISRWIVVVDVDGANHKIIERIQIGSGFDAL